MSIPINYAVSEADYVNANRRSCSLLFRSRRGLVLPIICGLIWTTIIAAGLPRDWTMLVPVTLGLFVVFAVVMWAFVVAMNVLLMPRQARRLYRQTQALHAHYDLTWTDKVLKFDSERGVQLLPWSDFIKWAQDENGIILYVSDGMFYTLPASTVPPAARAAVRDRLIAYGVPEWRAWRSLPKRPAVSAS